MGTLDAYRKNVYSQNGEDGVLAEIVRRLGLPSHTGFCVDVGASDGTHGSNVRYWIEQGWNAVLIDRDLENFQSLADLARQLPQRIHALCRLVGYGKHNSLDEHLNHTNAPLDFALLSIDVDGYDLQIWEATRLYRPKIVVIEINSGIPLGVRQVHSVDGAQGASFTAMLDLGARKGYRLACHTGNMIFVAAELFAALGLPEHECEHPEALFNYAGPPLEAA